MAEDINWEVIQYGVSGGVREIEYTLLKIVKALERIAETLEERTDRESK